MNYWLFKSEPITFGIDHLKKKPNGIDHWDGVRNYQARNMLRDEIKKGDLAFFYHSNCAEPGIVGTMQIVKSGYPDPFALDPESDYYDPKASIDNPRWFMVDVKFQAKFKQVISLQELKLNPKLAEMQVARRGNRLSITRVAPYEWGAVLELVGNC